MGRPRHVGDDQLDAAHRRAGQIISACARLEEAISYLEWQLTAYSWDKDNPQACPADRQTALRAERAKWDMYMKVESRLARVTKAFEAPNVSGRIKRVQRLKELRRDWEDLRESVRKLARKRNDVVHATVAYNNGKVIRQIGRPWNRTTVVSAADDDALWSALGQLSIEIGRYTTELGKLLPFADDDQIIVD